jgi:hypothetical protein
MGTRSHTPGGTEVTLSLDDGEIYVRQDGPQDRPQDGPQDAPDDAPALLLIHGNASSARWRLANGLLPACLHCDPGGQAIRFM